MLEKDLHFFLVYYINNYMTFKNLTQICAPIGRKDKNNINKFDKKFKKKWIR